MGDKIKITNNTPRVHGIGSHCVLAPGVNLVDASAWAEARKIELVGHHLRAGDLEEGETVKSNTSAEELPSDALTKLTPRAAAELVAETLDSRVLRAWAKVETRPAVKKAIALQIETINAAAKEDDEDENDKAKK